MKIALRGLSKSYGCWQQQTALVDLNLEIPPGQIVAVVGANGAGKTTLLRLLATLAAPSAGQILFDDEVLNRERIDLRKRLYFLGDVPAMIQTTVVGHLATVLKLYERDTADRAARTAEILAELEILPLVEQELRRLSRGEYYKTGLTAMIVTDCDLWLLDEPFASGIDPLGQACLRKELRAAADRGRTVLFSTQILEIAEKIADRVCVLSKGRVRAFDTVANLTEQNEGQDLASVLAGLREEEFYGQG
jgi:ABC-type multidrug transport system ATPase subunit